MRSLLELSLKFEVWSLDLQNVHNDNTRRTRLRTKPLSRRAAFAAYILFQTPDIDSVSSILAALAHSCTDSILLWQSFEYREALLGIVVGVCFAEFVTTLRDDADAAPRAITRFKNFVDDRLRWFVAFTPHGSGISVFHFGATSSNCLTHINTP